MSCFSPEGYSSPDNQSHLCRGLITPITYRKGGSRARQKRWWKLQTKTQNHLQHILLWSNCALLLFQVTVLWTSLLLSNVSFFWKPPDRNLNRDMQRSFEMSGWCPSPIVLCSVSNGLILRWKVHRSPPEIEEEKKSVLLPQTKPHLTKQPERPGRGRVTNQHWITQKNWRMLHTWCHPDQWCHQVFSSCDRREAPVVTSLHGVWSAPAQKWPAPPVCYWRWSISLNVLINIW